MILPMLRAVVHMLEDSTDVNLSIKTACALEILGEIIKDLEKKDGCGWKDSVKPASLPEAKTAHTIQEKPKPENKVPDAVQIIVDDDRRISEIRGLPLDGEILLNGVKMTHQQAIGKTFTTGKIL